MRVLLFFTCVVAARAVSESKPTCQYEGRTYKAGDRFPAGDGCNSCFCSQQGNIGCTEMACVRTCTYRGQTYRAGDTFPARDGCNICFCSRGGHVGCTERACNPPRLSKRRSYTPTRAGCQYNGKTYKKNETFPAVDGCNDCFCAGNDLVGCTLMACPEKGPGVSKRAADSCWADGKYYRRGERFIHPDGCNRCTCYGNDIAACTLKACTQNKGCRVGSRIYQVGQRFIGPDGCNECRCSSDGMVTCTQRACS